jgi:uncharacterized paraquat-inducible protein A
MLIINMNEQELKNSLMNNRIQKLAGSNKMPSIPAMAGNLTKSVINNAKSVISGNSLKTSPEEANRRLSICKGCEFFNSQQERCGKCGCYMAVKTYMKAERCPVGKW